MRFAIINEKNIVVSVVVWPDGKFVPPRGHTVVQSDVAQPGNMYDPISGTFSPLKNS